MIRRCLIVILLLSLDLAIAGDARTQALGGRDLPYFLDDSQILENPALMAKFNSRAALELSTATQNGYGLLKIGDMILIGAAILRPNSDFDEGYFSLPATIQLPNNNLSILAGVKLDNIAFGIGVHTAGWSEYSKVVTGGTDVIDDRSSGAIGINAGSTYSLDEMLVDAAFRIRINSFKSEYKVGTSTTANQLDGGTSVKFSARAFMPIGNFKFVPAAEFNTISFGYKTINGSTSTVYDNTSAMSLGAGIGAQIPILGDGWIAPGAMFEYSSSKTEPDDTTKNTMSMMILPKLSLSAEVPALKWLTLRAGIVRSFGTVSGKSQINNTIVSESSESYWSYTTQPDLVSLGTGLKLFDERLTIDGTVHYRLLISGPYTLSGVTRDLFTQVTATFQFPE